MKKYLLFAGEHYYPGGGWNDFIGSYRSIEEAATRARRHLRDSDSWAHQAGSKNK